MVVVGLTGGIGAGKSTVAALLVEHGAALVDADQVAREVVEPDGPAYQPLVDRFGPGILGESGRIDRPSLAAIAFADPTALADLNAITHPAIGVEMLARRDRHAAPGAVVVMDIPLLRAEHRDLLSLAAVVVVDAPHRGCPAPPGRTAADERGGRPGPHGRPARPGHSSQGCRFRHRQLR